MSSIRHTFRTWRSTRGTHPSLSSK